MIESVDRKRRQPRSYQSKKGRPRNALEGMVVDVGMKSSSVGEHPEGYIPLLPILPCPRLVMGGRPTEPGVGGPLARAPSKMARPLSPPRARPKKQAQRQAQRAARESARELRAWKEPSSKGTVPVANRRPSARCLVAHLWFQRLSHAANHAHHVAALYCSLPRLLHRQLRTPARSPMYPSSRNVQRASPPPASAAVGCRRRLQRRARGIVRAKCLNGRLQLRADSSPLFAPQQKRAGAAATSNTTCNSPGPVWRCKILAARCQFFFSIGQDSGLTPPYPFFRVSSCPGEEL